MLKTSVLEGSYHDSVALMLLTNHISQMDGVKKVSIMMATPANKDIFKQSGLYTDALDKASSNDMVIVADIDDDNLMEEILKESDKFFKEDNDSNKTNEKIQTVISWDKAMKAMPHADLAVISVAGAYAAIEADRALDNGMNVFMFSDNVSIEDERKLKEKAHDKGLVVMGPDCGTGIIDSVPIAFTNDVAPGRIGIIGASGTGIQELTTIIDRLGEGVTNALGTGGRDLREEIGGITTLDLIDAMEKDPDVDVLIVLSKPPAKSIRDKISKRLKSFSKPVVTLFVGEKPSYHEKDLYHAYTLDEAARLAVSLLRDAKVEEGSFDIDGIEGFKKTDNKSIKAYYSGGTLGNEAAMLIKDAMNLNDPPEDIDGFMLNVDGHTVIDLGDDAYTKGRPHPMIDPGVRIDYMTRALEDESTGVILFDVVLGYGSHEDMAGALIPTIKTLSKKAEEEGRKLFFVSTVCGTRKDYQGYDEAVNKLEEAGVLVCASNKIACQVAIDLVGLDLKEAKKEIRDIEKEENLEVKPSDKIMAMLEHKPNVVNIGLKSFAQVCEKYGSQVVQFDWTPPAGGNIKLMKALNFIRSQEKVDIDSENKEVLAKIVGGQPVIRDVVLAKEVIEEFNQGKVILHAGPPIDYPQMPPTVQGSCIGAVLFEGWADDEEGARALLESGEITFIPCHHVNAVGPMGGITSANMPVFVVENVSFGNKAYCTMNEGIGKVLRFGAYDKEVVDRLKWMRDILGPSLARAIKSMDDGLQVNPLVAKAIAMGDEFHQRNIAASLSFFKEVGPIITGMDMDEDDKLEVMKFLADTDQFFLNIMMASSKAIMDGAREGSDGTVVTALCRNGVDFGIRIAGMGDQWFTGPVNTPMGLYFTGYDAEDGCPDIGDSAITETLGVGGVAMIAAPAVTRFVGAGGYQDAFDTSNLMTEIYLDHNPNYTIPNWDFKGSCLGLDAALVVEKQILPVINTGIAHRIPGYGQIGAGTVKPPLEAFEKAILAYAKKLGFEG
ncbi:MAG: acyl-CoA synthetase FdrA [Tissierellia bacterium]|nr:acyl-CoA synthetase FdrA [Tissierellia bacterium]